MIIYWGLDLSVWPLVLLMLPRLSSSYGMCDHRLTIKVLRHSCYPTSSSYDHRHSICGHRLTIIVIVVLLRYVRSSSYDHSIPSQLFPYLIVLRSSSQYARSLSYDHRHSCSLLHRYVRSSSYDHRHSCFPVLRYVRVYVCLTVCLRSAWLFVCVYVQACVIMCWYACTYMCMLVCMRNCVYVCMHACRFADAQIRRFANRALVSSVHLYRVALLVQRYLLNTASFVLCVSRRVKDHHNLLHTYSPLLKKICKRQAVLGKWYPLKQFVVCYRMIYNILCYAMLCYAMLCYAMLYYTILQYIMIYYNIIQHNIT